MSLDENPDIDNALTYYSPEPDVRALRHAYTQTLTELEGYFDLCRNSYDDRRNWWAGKSRDHRKHGADAFPWEGAADMESHVIDERITRMVSIFMAALKRSNVSAFAVEPNDVAKAATVTNFLKWMISSGYIPRFDKEMELGANYLLERGIMISYVGWHREDRKVLQRLSLEEMTLISPDLGEAITSGEADEAVAELLQMALEGTTQERALKAIQELRETGFAELPLVQRQINAPEVLTLAPDGDFFFPPYVTDPQRAPYCFWRTYYTAQELENKVITDGWDPDFVEMVIDKYKGVTYDLQEDEPYNNRSSSLTDNSYTTSDLIEIIYGYQRLVDKTDNAEGIYCTVFHREYTGGDIVKPYAKFELLNGFEDYPVVVTKLSEDSKRLYDTTTVPDLLRGIQNQVKVERDSRIDRNSLATLPPIMHPVGNSPKNWKPGGLIPYRRKGEFEFGPAPSYNQGSIEMEATQLGQADRLMGLDEGSDISLIRQQFLVNKYLQHISNVVKMCYKCFQRFGPASIFFRVTGNSNPQTLEKGVGFEDYDVTINYDILNNNQDIQKAKLEQLVSLTQLDRNGLIDMDKLLAAIASSIDPVLSDAILQPLDEANQNLLKDVTDDLAKIYAGIEMPARPNATDAALQIIQGYLQQPDVQARLQSDQAFAERLQKYTNQYEFNQQQQINASQYGQFGTQAAQMGGVETQNM